MEKERIMESSSEGSERKKMTEFPPENDCCPICFGDFSFPCRTDCNHWFCANCILEYWQHGVALKPCKCPLCSRNISRLTLEASLHHSQDPKAVEAMRSVNHYNRLYVGGIQGLLKRAREFPWLMKRLLLDMMDPDRYDYYHNKVQWVAMLLGMLLSEVIPSPSDRITVPVLFQFIAFAVFMIMQLAGFYRRRQLHQRVRQLVVDMRELDDINSENHELRQRIQEIRQSVSHLAANHP